MKTITFEVPDNTEIEESDARKILAARLFEKGSLSLGQAAALAGISKQAFMDSLSQFGVSVFSGSTEDIDADLRNAQNYHR